MDDVVSAAGLKITPENRKEVHAAIKELLQLDAKCPDVWREVKKRLAEDEHGFIDELHAAFVSKGMV